MPETAEEQLPGTLPVGVCVEPEAEVGDIQVDGQGDGGEGPRGDVQQGGCRAQSDQGQAVAQGDAPAQGGVGDRHHAVAPSGVVLAEAPAQGVEMRELPGVEDSSQKKCSSIQAASGCCPAHDGWDGPDNSPDPRVGNADPLQRRITAGVQENVEEPQGSCEWIHPPGQKGDSWNGTASGKGHS